MKEVLVVPGSLNFHRNNVGTDPRARPVRKEQVGPEGRSPEGSSPLLMLLHQRLEEAYFLANQNWVGEGPSLISSSRVRETSEMFLFDCLNAELELFCYMFKSKKRSHWDLEI